MKETFVDVTEVAIFSAFFAAIAAEKCGGFAEGCAGEFFFGTTIALVMRAILRIVIRSMPK